MAGTSPARTGEAPRPSRKQPANSYAFKSRHCVVKNKIGAMGFYSQHLADCPRALGPDDGDEARVDGRAGKAEEHGRVAVGRG
jgi:hypothetical protein